MLLCDLVVQNIYLLSERFMQTGHMLFLIQIRTLAEEPKANNHIEKQQESDIGQLKLYAVLPHIISMS